MKSWLLSTFIILFLVHTNSCSEKKSESAFDAQVNSDREISKFEPPGDQCLVFVGQELDAIGGVSDWENGYMDHFRKPAGFTMYTDLMPGSESFGFIHKGLDGLQTTDDWGDGPSNMSLQLQHDNFKHLLLAIGLDMKDGHESKVASGMHDELINRLGLFIKDLGPRPVFLRIGYEFDGHGWNNYDPESYVKAFRRIKDMFDDLGVKNVAYVWQSKGRGVTQEDLQKYYPGDEYVDWTGFSFFAPDNENHPMIQFSRTKGKPIFIAEATPVIVPTDSDKAQALDFNDPTQSKLAWESWFIPFFRTIDNNRDVIKAFSYINCHWKSHEMWDEVNYFNKLDVRIQLDEELSKQWMDKLSEDTYLEGSEGLFEQLWGSS